jgi:hypothetical protein
MKNLLQSLANYPSTSMLELVVEHFKALGCVVELTGSNVSDFGRRRWPNAPGVYVVRTIADRKVLYIGMTGKLSGKDSSPVELRNGRLSHRAGRWTPYVFQAKGTYSGYWECGPNFKNNTQRPPETSDNSYRHHFPLESILVQCFDLSNHWREVSPSFLEALLLQAHLLEIGTLPLGNQDF